MIFQLKTLAFFFKLLLLHQPSTNQCFISFLNWFNWLLSTVETNGLSIFLLVNVSYFEIKYTHNLSNNGRTLSCDNISIPWSFLLITLGLNMCLILPTITNQCRYFFLCSVFLHHLVTMCFQQCVFSTFAHDHCSSECSKC